MKTRICSILAALVVAIAASALPAKAAPPPTAVSEEAFSLQLAPVSGCDPEQVVNVRWHAPGPEVAVRVLVVVGGEEQLFAESGGSGEKATGPWVSAGMRFVLREAREGRLVAEASAGAHCERTEAGDAPDAG